MRLFVAITDLDWYEHLSRLNPDEVNFWRPSSTTQFRALSPGEPLLFKLHSPNDYIVGGGFLTYSSILPVSLAWSAFGEKNGAATEQDMRALIERHRHAVPNPAEDYSIGCILLRPFFFERAAWIPLPQWARGIQRGKGYNTDEEEGRRLWTEVQARLAAQPIEEEARVDVVDGDRYGQPQLVLPRLGQGSFRVIVTDSYQRQCALTGSHVLHVLDAAHIRPYAAGGTHSPNNGLLLRQDIHTLFDRGYITVAPDYRIEVSRRIREEFDNGKEYYALSGKPIHLPARTEVRPSPELLTWHNENRFRA